MNIHSIYPIKLDCFISPKGTSCDSEDQSSRFGFYWWYWIPCIHTQARECNGFENPAVIRLIWLCFAVGLNIGREGVYGDNAKSKEKNK